jgi:hypothetical protein
MVNALKRRAPRPGNPDDGARLTDERIAAIRAKEPQDIVATRLFLAYSISKQSPHGLASKTQSSRLGLLPSSARNTPQKFNHATLDAIQQSR